MSRLDPNNLTGRQVFLLLLPFLAAAIPVVLLLSFSELYLVRVILGGWNLPLVMIGVFILTDVVARRFRKVDRDKQQ